VQSYALTFVSFVLLALFAVLAKFNVSLRLCITPTTLILSALQESIKLLNTSIHFIAFLPRDAHLTHMRSAERSICYCYGPVRSSVRPSVTRLNASSIKQSTQHGKLWTPFVWYQKSWRNCCAHQNEGSKNITVGKVDTFWQTFAKSQTWYKIRTYRKVKKKSSVLYEMVTSRAILSDKTTQTTNVCNFKSSLFLEWMKLLSSNNLVGRPMLMLESSILAYGWQITTNRGGQSHVTHFLKLWALVWNGWS